MKFGTVNHPGGLDLSLPKDHKLTRKVLNSKKRKLTGAYVGCAKWNKTELKGFYPRGTKDELTYYSRQFNSIELNATYYRIFPKETVKKWYNKTPDNFRFYPKIPQSISQYKRLKNTDDELNAYWDSITTLEEKLGMIFLQMHPYFSPKDFDTLSNFITNWSKEIPLAVELRHKEWYADKQLNEELFQLISENQVTHIITDTAGRRDLVHMQLSTPRTFIRYTGANHESDYSRLDEWIKRIKSWAEKGLEELNFFVHQNIEKESPLLSAHFIKSLNRELHLDLNIPTTIDDQKGLTNTLF